MPVQAKANHLQLDPILDELSNLNALELRLISLRVPFMKMVALPSGKQRSIQGLERWSGVLEWSTGVDYWTGVRMCMRITPKIYI